ncbi:hypothetical protein BJ166DRAFT_56854 [Pestalotiopsis sp. NC0098]|nr:hypothetical protein BJ166DRAFT_56854 [Pestalotiopsis sp. NC0098]
MMDRVASSGRNQNKPPLRTYSKRSTPSTTSPPVKRRRTESSDVDIHTIAGRFAQKPDTASRPKDDVQPQASVPKPAQQPKKGTILSYFKVRSPSSGTSSSSCAQSSEALPPPSTPPSSSPLEPSEDSRKRRRRLTTKPPLRNSETPSSSQEPDEADRSETDQQTRVQTDTESALQDLSDNMLNQDPQTEPEKFKLHKRGTKKGSRPKQATVQTTLSLSLTEKQFVECNECNMLYNPYHEKDLKMHKRRHAAALKEKKKTDMDDDRSD